MEGPLFCFIGNFSESSYGIKILRGMRTAAYKAQARVSQAKFFPVAFKAAGGKRMLPWFRIPLPSSAEPLSGRHSCGSAPQTASSDRYIHIRIHNGLLYGPAGAYGSGP